MIIIGLMNTDVLRQLLSILVKLSSDMLKIKEQAIDSVKEVYRNEKGS